MKKTWLMTLSFFFLILLTGHAYASYKDVYISDTDSIVFDTEKTDTYFVYKDGTWGDFTDSVSSDKQVATTYVSADEDHVVIEAIGRGTCTISVKDENNKKKNIKVTVEDSYVYGSIKDATELYRCWYGSKKIVVNTVPNCTGTLKIRKDTYKFSVGDSGSKTVKLKKVYKLNEKVKVTIKKGDAKVTQYDKLKSVTFSCYANGANKKIKIEISNTHKGDIIYVKHRGKTYKKTVTKDYDNKLKAFTFKTKKKVRKNNEKITVTIKNKSKKRLDKYTFVLTDGHDDIYKDEGHVSE